MTLCMRKPTINCITGRYAFIPRAGRILQRPFVKSARSILRIMNHGRKHPETRLKFLIDPDKAPSVFIGRLISVAGKIRDSIPQTQI